MPYQISTHILIEHFSVPFLVCWCAGEGPEGDVQGEEDQRLLGHEEKPACEDAQAYTG